MSITASELRNNAYRLLDDVARTGKPLTVVRKGRRLKIVCEDTPSRLANLARHDCIKGDAEALVHLDWSREWKHALS